MYQTRKRLIHGAKQKPRFLLCELKKATGEAGEDEGPVDLCPAERVRHGWRTPGLQAQPDCEAQQGLFQHLTRHQDNLEYLPPLHAPRKPQ